eukprot:26479_1
MKSSDQPLQEPHRRKKKRKHSKKRRHSKKRKIDKKRKREKKLKRIKNKKTGGSHGGDNISGVLTHILGVGAFALALWMRVRPPKDDNIQPQPLSTSSQSNNSLTPSEHSSQSVQTSSSTENPSISNISEKSDDIDIDTSEFGKPVTELSGAEMRELVKSNLGRNYDESQSGNRYGQDEIKFISKLHKSNVNIKTIAEAFNRTHNSIGVVTCREGNVSYTALAKGDIRPRTMYSPTMEWRAESALMELPNGEGTTSQIRKIISEKYRDLDCTIAAGRKNDLRWQNTLGCALSKSKLFQSIGKSGCQNIWRLHKPIDPKGLMVNIKEDERKQRKKKRGFSKR